MQKRKLLILGSFILLLCKFSFAQDSSEGIQIWLEEEDGSPSIIVYKEKVSNGTLTDNSDGTASLNTSGSGSVSDTAYAASWDGVTTIAPSKNAVYDKVETLTNYWTRTSPYIYPTTITDNVGIGTTAPLGWLQVGTSPSAPILFVGKNGNIGVGKTAPSQVLDVSGTIAGTTITGANVTSGADPGHTHGSGSITEVDPNAILTNGTRGLSGNWYNANYQIATLGNIGVGNTAPVYTLDVTGDIRATGDIISADQYTVTGDIGASGNLGAGTTAPIYRLDVQGSGNVILNMTGNVGVATTSPVQKLDVTGNIRASGTGIFDTLSITNPIDISAQTNLSGDTENVLTGDALSIGATITRDTEWNSLDFLVGTATGSLSAEIVAGTAPGGELGGTWASPAVDATHSGSAHHSAVTLGAGNHSSLALSGQELTLTVAKDIVAGVGLSGGEDNVLPGADADTTLTFDATELSALTWSAGGSSNFSWTYDLSGTDPKINFNSNSVNIETGNMGIGNTAPQGLLDVGTSPGVGLIVKNTGNVGIGTTAPARKLDIIGTMRTTETSPLMRLNILDVGGSVGVGTTIPGAHLHKDKAYVIDRLKSWLTGGTSVNFTVKGSVFPGTGPFYNLFVGQTSIPGGLTVAGSASTTVPADHLVIIDIIATAGTAPGMGIIMDGHEQ